MPKYKLSWTENRTARIVGDETRIYTCWAEVGADSEEDALEMLRNGEVDADDSELEDSENLEYDVTEESVEETYDYETELVEEPIKEKCLFGVI